LIKNKYICFTHDRKTYLVKFQYSFLQGVKNVEVCAGEEGSKFLHEIEVKKVKAYPGLIGIILDKLRIKAIRYRSNRELWRK
jgi:hypothetical protein